MLDAALAERGLVPAAPAPVFTAPADARLTGVTFDELWARFLARIRHVDEGTHKLYAGYGRNSVDGQSPLRVTRARAVTRSGGRRLDRRLAAGVRARVTASRAR